MNKNDLSILGYGKPWKQQYHINDTQDGDITGWTKSGDLPTPLAWSQCIVTNNRLYTLGGYSYDGKENFITSTIYSAPINPDGMLGSWSVSGNLPINLDYSQAVVIKDKLYLLGGYTYDGSKNCCISDIYSANINADETLGSWSKVGNLPVPLYSSQAVVIGDKLYMLGGKIDNDVFSSSGIISDIYRANINADGTLGSWSKVGDLPITLAGFQAIIIGNRLYLLGGDTSSDGVIFTMYRAPVNSDGTIGSFSPNGNLPMALEHFQTLVTKYKVYLLGGWNEFGGYVSSIYSAPINEDSTLGYWTLTGELPLALAHSQAVVTNGKLHMIGGCSFNGPISAIHTAPISGGLNDYTSF